MVLEVGMTEAQPTLFDKPGRPVAHEQIVLFALGDFQSRGKILVEREIALDRLLGAFRRAAEFFESDHLSDLEIVTQLSALGAKIHEVQSFVAKHPYRVEVPKSLAIRAEDLYTITMGQTNKGAG
jgi:hypothetical protein